MAKQNNIIFWIMGIIIFVIVVAKLPLIPFFAIVTETVCAEGVTDYYPLDGVLTDLKGNQDATNNGAIFITGKLGSNAIEFNGTNSISFPTLQFNLSTGFWMNDYSNEDGWIYKTYENTSILSNTFMLGLNGSIDEIVVGTNISGLSNIQPCYITTYEENVTCQEYAKSQVPSLSSGCLNVTGDFYPSCSYSIETTSQYEVEDNLCSKYFYCQNPCLTTGNCYTSNQDCIEKLTYDCYLIINNICAKKTDYASCVTNISYYENLTGCQADLNVTTTDTTTTTTTPTPTDATTMETIKAKLDEEIFKIGDFSVKLFHLFITLIAIITILYFTGAFGKK